MPFWSDLPFMVFQLAVAGHVFSDSDSILLRSNRPDPMKTARSSKNLGLGVCCNTFS